MDCFGVVWYLFSVVWTCWELLFCTFRVLALKTREKYTEAAFVTRRTSGTYLQIVVRSLLVTQILKSSWPRAQRSLQKHENRFKQFQTTKNRSQQLTCDVASAGALTQPGARVLKVFVQGQLAKQHKNICSELMAYQMLLTRTSAASRRKPTKPYQIRPNGLGLGFSWQRAQADQARTNPTKSN